MLRRVLFSAVILFSIGVVIANRPTGQAAPPSPTVVPSATRDAVATVLAHQDHAAALITFDSNPDIAMSANGEGVTVRVGVQNRDTAPHTFSAEAHFYRAPKEQLGDDPAEYGVTAGFTTLTLAAGEKRTVEIDAKNFNHEAIKAVTFTAVIKDR